MFIPCPTSIPDSRVPNFHYCRYQYICDGTNKTPDVPAQANPEQERSIETNLEETTFQPDSSLKDQLQSNAVKSNLTKMLIQAALVVFAGFLYSKRLTFLKFHWISPRFFYILRVTVNIIKIMKNKYYLA